MLKPNHSPEHHQERPNILYMGDRHGNLDSFVYDMLCTLQYSGFPELHDCVKAIFSQIPLGADISPKLLKKTQKIAAEHQEAIKKMTIIMVGDIVCDRQTQGIEILKRLYILEQCGFQLNLIMGNHDRALVSVLFELPAENVETNYFLTMLADGIKVGRKKITDDKLKPEHLQYPNGSAVTIAAYEAGLFLQNAGYLEVLQYLPETVLIRQNQQTVPVKTSEYIGFTPDHLEQIRNGFTSTSEIMKWLYETNLKAEHLLEILKIPENRAAIRANMPKWLLYMLKKYQLYHYNQTNNIITVHTGFTQKMTEDLLHRRKLHTTTASAIDTLNTIFRHRIEQALAGTLSPRLQKDTGRLLDFTINTDSRWGTAENPGATQITRIIYEHIQLLFTTPNKQPIIIFHGHDDKTKDPNFSELLLYPGSPPDQPIKIIQLNKHTPKFGVNTTEPFSGDTAMITTRKFETIIYPLGLAPAPL